MSEIKQVLVLRTKYPDGKGGFFKPRTGKLMAQISHASMAFMIEIIRCNSIFLMQDYIKEWMYGLQTKVCLQVESEEELLEIYKKAEAANLEVHLITDAGLTEFNGVPTKTALAIGPYYSEKINEITGNLKLY
jgi:PTH2 family peptidyl-tRNA hydrolase